VHGCCGMEESSKRAGGPSIWLSEAGRLRVRWSGSLCLGLLIWGCSSWVALLLSSWGTWRADLGPCVLSWQLSWALSLAEEAQQEEPWAFHAPFIPGWAGWMHHHLSGQLSPSPQWLSVSFENSILPSGPEG
jgi:hypothetical protein